MADRIRGEGQSIDRDDLLTQPSAPGPTPHRGGDPSTEWEVLVPVDDKSDSFVSEAWIRTIAAASGPLAFHLVGADHRVSIRFVVPDEDAATVLGQLRVFFPMVLVRKAERPVGDLWNTAGGSTVGAMEFGLAREFMVPFRIAEEGLDPLTPIVAALALARADEVAFLQVLFEPVRAPWATHILQAVTSPDGEPFFIDAPSITTLADEKCSAPLYAVVLRVAIQGENEDHVLSMLRGLGGALSQYGSPDRNTLAPLGCEDIDELVEDILARQTRRTGMVLSLPELTSIVRLPGPTIRTPALLRTLDPVETLPREVLGDEGARLGEARHNGALVPVRISAEARMQHVYVIGASGTGKSTLLSHMILDDIASGAGVGVLDPHGDLIDTILSRLPDVRMKDVLLFDPTDPNSMVGWNILGAHSDVEKELLASDLVGVFRRLSTSWGDQMSVVLGNAVMAFLESRQGGTLIDLRHFLLDDAFRRNFLQTVADPHVLSFWESEWPLLVGKRPQAPILTRLDILLRSRLVRQAVTRKDGLNFRRVIDDSKIFLSKLSQGAIGEENAALLGSLLVSKFHQVSLSRQNVALEARRPFYLFLDEFHSFVTPSMASLFSGLRKYRLGVTVAHHDLHQLHANAPEVERAVLTNTFTRVFFRVSDEDARKLERSVGDFTADDLTSLRRGEAICRVEQRDQAFRLRTVPLDHLTQTEAEANRARFETPRASEPSDVATVPTPVQQPLTEPISKVRADEQPIVGRPAQATVEVPPRPGRGGPIHKYLQGLIGEWARAAGFRVEIEHELADEGRVDVALFREHLSIACEIGGTTTVEQEMGNIEKCLGAGFTTVVAVSLDKKLLRRLTATVDERVPAELRKQVTLCAPEELLTILKAYEIAAPEVRVAGYKVRVRHHKIGESNTEERRRAVADVMLKSLKRLRETNE
jgi:hypothetical protein